MELKEQPQEKVRQLEESILEEAKAAAALKEEEAQKLHSQAMEKAENEILREIYGKIQAQVAQIEAASTKETVNFELAQKRELLEMRRQLQEQVFAAVRERLVRFTKTEDYAAWRSSMTMKPPFWWCAPRMQRWCRACWGCFTGYGRCGRMLPSAWAESAWKTTPRTIWWTRRWTSAFRNRGIGSTPTPV